MSKEDFIQARGKIETNLSHGVYSVVTESGHKIQCRMAGRMSKRHIRIIPGDTVSVEISPYDLTKGRIVYRHLVENGRVLEPGEVPTSAEHRPPPKKKFWHGRR